MFLVGKDGKLWKILSRFFHYFDPTNESTSRLCKTAHPKKLCWQTSVTLTHKPAIITFLHDIDNVTVPQFQLIIILRSIAVEGLVANSKNQKDTTC